jgi:hypothetical protein
MRARDNLAGGACAIMLISTLFSGGCCPVEEDSLEPNDTIAQATELSLGTPSEGRAVQGNLDVFAVNAGPNQTLRFRFNAVNPGNEEDCAAFQATAPDGTVLYRETQVSCGERLPEQVDGAVLNSLGDEQYELVVPAGIAGSYLLTIDERGHADNICDFRWTYRVKANAD